MKGLWVSLMLVFMSVCFLSAPTFAEESALEVSVEGEGSQQQQEQQQEQPAVGAAAAAAATEAKKRMDPLKKKWKLDMYSLEDQWKTGDDKVELEYEHDVNQRIAAKRQQRSGLFDFNDPERIKRILTKNPKAYESQVGQAAMIFVEIRSPQSNGKPWDKYHNDLLAVRWASLMRTGGLSANVYSIGEEETEPRLLLQVDRGWTGPECVKFALAQPETVKVTKDQRDWYPGDEDELDDEF